MISYAEAEVARDTVVPLALAFDDVTSVGIGGPPGAYIVIIVAEGDLALPGLPVQVNGVPVVVTKGERADMYREQLSPPVEGD